MPTVGHQRAKYAQGALIMADEETEYQEPENAVPEPEQEQQNPDVGAEESDSPSEESPDTGARSEKSRIEKRIDELTANYRSAERERDYWRQVAQQQQAEPEQLQEPEQKPTADQFDDYDQYIEALTDWKVRKQAETWQEQQQREREQQTQAQRQAEFQKRAAEFAKEAPDFWDVAGNPNVPITQSVVDAAMDSDIGPKVLYHLGQNPDEAARVSQMNPTAAAREIGRLEAQLRLPTKPKTSNAAEPPPTVSGAGETAGKSLDDMTTEEFMATRRKQLQR